MNNKLPLKIIFLNVQHGDGIIVLLPNEEAYETAMIIDCNDGIKAYNVLKEYNIKFIEAIVISHFHSDHYRGFNILLNKLKDERIKMNNIFYYQDRIQRKEDEQKHYQSFLVQICQMVKNKELISNSNVIDGNRKEKSIYSKDDLRINLIYPRQLDITNEYEINNCSGIVEIEYKKNKVLMTGDLEESGWFKLYNYIKEYQHKDCLNENIVKMPHHGAFYKGNGSEALSTKDVLDFLNPQYAIISTAENKKYQHPNINTIKELKRKEIKILCTNSTTVCQNVCECFGDIIVEVDDKIIVHDYDIKSHNLYCTKNF